MTVGPTRRGLLAASAAGAALLISGCRGVQVLGSPPPAAPDVRLLRAAITAESQLVARYHAAIGAAAGSSVVTAKLTAVLAEHEQHLAQLRSRLIVPSGSARAPKPAATSPAAGTAGLTGTLSELAAAEQAAAQRLAADLLTAPPSLAQLMASISASEATHVPLLRQLGRTA